MRVWKTVPTIESRHTYEPSHASRDIYAAGRQVVAANPDGPDNLPSSWLYGCESLDVALARVRGHYGGRHVDVYELEVGDDVRVERWPQSGGRGYLRFKRCEVVAKAEW